MTAARTMSDHDDELHDALSVAEYAAVEHVSPGTVRNWLHAGDIDGVRVGVRRIMIPRSQLGRMRKHITRKPRD